MRLPSFHHSKRWFYRLARTSTVTSTLFYQSQLLGVGKAAARIPQTPSISFTSRLHSGTNLYDAKLRTQSTQTESDMTQHALQIVEHAIEAVDPYVAVKSHFQIQDDLSTLNVGNEQLRLEDYEEVVIVAFGKASSAMATAVLEQLESDEGRLRIPASSGVVICKDDHATDKEINLLLKYGIEVQMASHPVPDLRSAVGADKLMRLVESHASPKTLLVCCISGGGSALFCRPKPPLTLEDLQNVNSELLASGMGIQEMNVIRKRLEEGKGGRLAANSHPSQLVTLVLSDVLVSCIMFLQSLSLQ